MRRNNNNNNRPPPPPRQEEDRVSSPSNSSGSDDDFITGQGNHRPSVYSANYLRRAAEASANNDNNSTDDTSNSNNNNNNRRYYNSRKNNTGNTNNNQVPAASGYSSSGTNNSGRQEQQARASSIEKNAEIVREIMQNANPNGPVDYVVRFRPLVRNETPCTRKPVVNRPQNGKQEVSFVNSDENAQKDEDQQQQQVVKFENFNRVFHDFSESADITHVLRGAAGAASRGINNIAIIANGTHQGGKSSFVRQCMRSYARSLFANAREQHQSVNVLVSATQIFNAQHYDLLRVSLEHPKGFYLDPARGDRKRELRASIEKDAFEIIDRAYHSRENALHHAQHIAGRSSAIYTFSVRATGSTETRRIFFVDLACTDRDTVAKSTEIDEQQNAAAENLSALYRVLGAWSSYSRTTGNPKDFSDPLIHQLPFIDDPKMFVSFVTCCSQSAQHQYDTISALEIGDELASIAQETRVAVEDQKTGFIRPPSSDPDRKKKFEQSVNINARRRSVSPRSPVGSLADGRRQSVLGGDQSFVIEQMEALRAQLRATEQERDNLKRGIVQGQSGGTTPKANTGLTPSGLEDTVKRGTSYPTRPSSAPAATKVATRDFQVQMVPSHVMQDDHGKNLDRSIEFAIEDVYDQLMRIPSLSKKKDSQGPSTIEMLQVQQAEKRLRIRAMCYEQLSSKVLKWLFSAPSKDAEKMLSRFGNQAAAAADAMMMAVEEEEETQHVSSGAPPSGDNNDELGVSNENDDDDQQQQQELQYQEGSEQKSRALPKNTKTASSGASRPLLNKNQNHNQNQNAAVAFDESSLPLDDIRRENAAAFMEAYRQKRLAGTGWNQNASSAQAPSVSASRPRSVSNAMSLGGVAPEELERAMEQRDRALDREAQTLKSASKRTQEVERDVKEADAARRTAETKVAELQKEVAALKQKYDQQMEDVLNEKQRNEDAGSRELREAQEEIKRLKQDLDDERAKKGTLSERAKNYSQSAQDRIRELEDENADLTLERNDAQRRLESDTADLKRLNERLEQELADVCEDRDATRKLADARRNREIAERCQRLEGELEDATAERDAAMARATKQNKESAALIEKLEDELAQMKEQDGAKEFDQAKQIREQGEKIAQLEDELRNSNASRDTANKRYDRLQADSSERIKSLEKEIDDVANQRSAALQDVSKTKTETVDSQRMLEKELDEERALLVETEARAARQRKDSSDRIRALEEELSETAAQRDAALSGTVAKIAKAVNERTSQLESDLAEVTAQRDRALERAATIQRESNTKIGDLQQELLDTKSKLDLLQYNHDKLQRESSDKIARLERELADVKKERDVLADELQRTNKNNADNITRIERINAELNNDNEKLRNAAAKKERDLNSQIQQFELENEDLKKTLENLGSRSAKQHKDAANKISSLEDQVDELKDENQKLIDEAKKNRSDNNSKFSRLERELEDAQKARDEAAAKAEQIDHEAKQLKEETARASEESRSRSIGIEDNERSYRELLDQTKRLEEEKEEAIRDRDEAQKRVDELKKQLQDETSALKKELAEEREDNEKLATKDKETSKSLREHQAKNRQLEQELQQQEIDAKLALKLAETEKANAERRAKEDDDRNKRRIADLEQLVEKAQDEAESAENLVKRFTNELEEATERAAELEAERDNLQEKVDELENQENERIQAQKEETAAAASEAAQERTRALQFTETLGEEKRNFEEQRDRELAEIAQTAAATKNQVAELKQSLEQAELDRDEATAKLAEARAEAEAAQEELQQEKVAAKESRAELMKTVDNAMARSANSRQIETDLRNGFFFERCILQKERDIVIAESELQDNIATQLWEDYFKLYDQYQSEKANLNEAVQVANSTVAQLRASQETLQAERDEAKNHLQEVEDSFDDNLTRAIADAMGRLQHAQRQQTAATEKAAAAEAKSNRLIQEAEREKQDVITVSQRQLAIYKAANECLVDESIARVGLMLSWVDSSTNYYTTLNRNVTSTLWKYLQEASDALDQADADYTVITADRDNLRDDLKREVLRAEDAEDDVARLKKRLRASELEAEQLQQDKDRLHNAFERNVREIEDEQDKYEALTRANTERLSQREADISNLQKHLENSRRREQQLDHELEEVKRAYEDATHQLDRAAREHDKLKDRLNKAEKSRGDLQNKVQDLKSVEGDLRDANYRLSQKADAASNEANQAMSRSVRETGQIANLQAEIDELNRAQANARRELVLLGDTLGVDLAEREQRNLPLGIISCRTASTKLLSRLADADANARNRQLELETVKEETAQAVYEASSQNSRNNNKKRNSNSNKSRGGINNNNDENDFEDPYEEIERLKAELERVRIQAHTRVSELQKAVLLLREKLEQDQDSDEVIDKLEGRIAELESYINNHLAQNGDTSYVGLTPSNTSPTNRGSRNPAANNSNDAAYIKQLENDLRQADEDVTNLNKRIRELRKELETERDQHNETRDKVAQLEKENDEIMEKNLELIDEHAALETQNSQLFEKNRDLESGSSGPGSPPARRPAGAGSKEEVLSELQTENTRLRESLEQREKLLQELKEKKDPASENKLTSKSASIDLVSKLQKENASLIRTNDQLSRQVAELTDAALSSTATMQ